MVYITKNDGIMEVQIRVSFLF